MINTEELLYVVDEFDVPQEPQPRNKVFKNGLWRRTAHVWVINEKKQILCQRRSMQKDISPGKWEAVVGGHIGPEDNYFSGAARELYEETGIQVKPADLDLFKIYKADKFLEYRGVFIYKWNGKIHEIKSEEAEVDEVKFVDLEILKEHLIDENAENWCLPGYEKEILSHLSTN